MKKEQKQPVVFTPGNCCRIITADTATPPSSSEILFPLRNTIVAGVMGSGRDTCIDSIIKSLIEENPAGTVSFIYIDTILPTASIFSSPKLSTPYNQLMSELDLSNYNYSARKLLERLISLVVYYTEYEFQIPNEKLVVIVNDYDGMPTYLKELITGMLEIATQNCPIKFILGIQKVSYMGMVLERVPYRITTRVDVDDSYPLMRSDLANTLADKYGSCWAYDTGDPGVYTKHEVTYNSREVLNDFLKNLDSGESETMQIVKDFLRIKNDNSVEGIEECAKELINSYTFWTESRIEEEFKKCLRWEQR